MTGANHGIGAGIARALALRGADVLGTYLREDHAAGDAERAFPGVVSYRAAKAAFDELHLVGRERDGGRRGES